MTERQTARELQRAGLVNDDEIEAAIDAALQNPAAGSVRLGGRVLDIAAALSAIPSTRAMLADPRKDEAFRREVVRSAILSAQL